MKYVLQTNWKLFLSIPGMSPQCLVFSILWMNQGQSYLKCKVKFRETLWFKEKIDLASTYAGVSADSYDQSNWQHNYSQVAGGSPVVVSLF